MTYNNIKSHKNPRLRPFSEIHIFGKTIGAGETEPQAALGLMKFGKSYILCTEQKKFLKMCITI